LNEDVGEQEGGIDWFLSFRGTYLWDIVNMRRNNMIAMTLVSFCAQCAASEGPYRNFVALRFSIARTLIAAVSTMQGSGNSKLAIVGMSMGATLAQFATAWLSVERAILSQNVRALITHGAPRVGNYKLGKAIASGPDLPYINFIMYRDLVPHIPPKLFGYQHASVRMVWMFIEPWFEAKLALAENPDDDGAIRYVEFAGNDADDELAQSLTFFDIADHMKYFMKLDSLTDLGACGGLGDKFFLNTAAIRMYDST
jgi:hypothetical protein